MICRFCSQDHALPLKKFCDRSDLEIKYDMLQKRVEELEASQIHTCHDDCQRLECAQRRKIEGLVAENKKMRSLLLDVSVELKEVGESFEIAVRQALGVVS